MSYIFLPPSYFKLFELLNPYTITAFACSVYLKTSIYKNIFQLTQKEWVDQAIKSRLHKISANLQMLWETKLVPVVHFKDSATELWKWLDKNGRDTGVSKL